MKKLLVLLAILFIETVTFGQVVEREEINGRIIVETDDVEGVTVYNTSSNKGTITNAKGEFTIAVTKNDILEVSALQFENFTVKIDDEILENKYLTVYLVEQVNKLDEVVIMPYDMLTGNLVADVKSVETFNPDLDAIYFGVANIYEYDFTDDYKSGVDNPFMNQGQFYNGVNVMAVLGMVLKPIFKGNNKDKKPKTQEDYYPSVSVDSKDLTDVYGREFLSNTFNIPEDQVEAFVAFVENSTSDYSLLDDGNEMKLIEHLYKKSNEFLKGTNAKD